MKLFSLKKFFLSYHLGMEVNNMNIRTWIHDKDVEKLEKVVWEGNGHLLLKHSSAHTKIRKFLEAVPRLMNDIKTLHEAAINGIMDEVLSNYLNGNIGICITFMMYVLLGRFFHCCIYLNQKDTT